MHAKHAVLHARARYRSVQLPSSALSHSGASQFSTSLGKLKLNAKIPPCYLEVFRQKRFRIPELTSELPNSSALPPPSIPVFISE
jgi:hypothetical protein